ncbi:MAG: hypothetical protein QF475_00525 [Candidatus Undinarchaeales archaeon]|nr:hypothetical protein [Candidatus Undinarchaeales archaeon]
MKKIAIITLAILLVSTISGCLGGGAGTPQDSVGQGYPGVEFIQFYPINNYVPEKSDASFYYAIQNNGYFDAENVQVMLYNCGDIKKGTHSWSEAADLGYTCNNYLPGQNKDPRDGITMKMPDRIQGVTGEVADAEISLETTNANLPVGESPHTVSARVRYDYQTTAIRDVVFTTFNNWKEKGGSIETGLLMSSSKPAPIEVSINAPDKAIIITEKKVGDVYMDQPQEFTIAVQIRNTGGGFLKDKSVNYVELCYDPVLVEVANPKDFITCKDLVDGDEAWDSCCNKIENQVYDPKIPNCLCVPADKQDTKLSLVGLTNQWRDVSAIFKTAVDDTGDAAVQVQDISNFGSTVEYTYMTDTSTQLTLLGQ